MSKIKKKTTYVYFPKQRIKACTDFFFSFYAVKNIQSPNSEHLNKASTKSHNKNVNTISSIECNVCFAKLLCTMFVNFFC